MTKLSGLAQEGISSLGLDQKGQAQVEKTVAGYSSPNTLGEKVSYAAYRVFNAVKSLFGQSDWQVSKKILEKNSIKRSE